MQGEDHGAFQRGENEALGRKKTIPQKKQGMPWGGAKGIVSTK